MEKWNRWQDWAGAVLGVRVLAVALAASVLFANRNQQTVAVHR